MDAFRPARSNHHAARNDLLWLTKGQKPTLVVAREERQVEIWDVPAVRFTDSFPGPVRVVLARTVDRTPALGSDA